LVGFYSSTWSWHPKTHLKKCLGTCLEPPFFGDVCFPSKKQDLDFPSTCGSFGFQVLPWIPTTNPLFGFYVTQLRQQEVRMDGGLHLGCLPETFEVASGTQDIPRGFGRAG